MSAVKHISFEELARNLADILNQVRTEQISLVVKYASGEQLLIKSLSPTRPGSGEDESNSTQQQPPNRVSTTENHSSMGAINELDPDSITPG